MAKAEMMCPFSGKSCKECPIYRGRHYYLCFCKQYRGYVKEAEKESRARASLGSAAVAGKQFEIPNRMPSAIDPFTIPMADISK